MQHGHGKTDGYADGKGQRQHFHKVYGNPLPLHTQKSHEQNGGHGQQHFAQIHFVIKNRVQVAETECIAQEITGKQR